MFVTEEERLKFGGLLGFYVPMMIIGGLASLSIWYSQTNNPAFPGSKVYAMAAVIFFSSLLFLWRAGQWARALLSAALTAAVVTVSAALLDLEGAISPSLSLSMILASWFVLVVFFGASLDERRANWLYPPAYRTIFARALILPPVLMVLALFLGLFSILMAALFQMSAPFVEDMLAGEVASLREQANPIMATGVTGVFLGAATALVRNQRVLLGAVRYAILFLARYLMPVLAVIALSLIAAMLVNGEFAGFPVAPKDHLALVFVHLILLNTWLVYQNGEGPHPPLWLGAGVVVGFGAAVILALPHLMVLSSTFPPSLDQYWLLILALTMSVFGIGIVSGLVPISKNWMPILGPLLIGLFMIIACSPILITLSHYLS
ncbi:MAG: hypothetical protein ACWA5L_06865 [bacterium]